MLVIVDANKIISTLLSKGKPFDIFLLNSFINKFDFISPEFLFTEINNNLDEILRRSKLSKIEVLEILSFIKEQIKPISLDDFNNLISEAEKLAPHNKDIQYFALALYSNCGIWSDEKGFFKQNKVRIFSSNELIKRLFSPYDLSSELP
jgi:predicted nucleic acid-binding protein